MIYECLFKDTVLSTDTCAQTPNGMPLPQISKLTNILRVNSKCYKEALPILYDRVTFKMSNIKLGSPNVPDAWLGPTTEKIRDLNISQCTLSPFLGELFPSLRQVCIEVMSKPQRLSLLPPPQVKIRMAKKVLKIYDDMCLLKVQHFQAKNYRNILSSIAEDPKDQWVFDALQDRFYHILGTDQYRMYVKVDLTAALPWIEGTYSVTAQDLHFSQRKVIGIYNASTQLWMFCINGKRIDIPELIGPKSEDSAEDGDDDTDSDGGEDADDDVTESEDEDEDDDNDDVDQDDD